ncbi:MAG: hypothetical protein HQL32_01335, partial [Planctomycetes bacterium]|nr:hypothetical protein [Planctomycetota bacterium]
MNTEIESHITQAVEYFKLWRSQRKGKSPIPEELWEEAVSLARLIGLNKASKALGLNHKSLKEHLSP